MESKKDLHKLFTNLEKTCDRVRKEKFGGFSKKEKCLINILIWLRACTIE